MEDLFIYWKLALPMAAFELHIAVKMTLIKVRDIKIDMLLQCVGIVNDQKNYCQSYLHFRLKPGGWKNVLERDNKGGTVDIKVSVWCQTNLFENSNTLQPLNFGTFCGLPNLFWNFIYLLY